MPTSDQSNPTDVKMLPGTGASASAAPVSSSTSPARQLAEVPLDELQNLAAEFGLDPTKFRTRQHLIAALHDRRQMIAGLDRESLMDVVRWGRRPVTATATRELLAQEVARITSMRFGGLSHRGLYVLARMRGCDALPDEPVPFLIRKLKKQESLFEKLNRKRRTIMGSIIESMVGEEAQTEAYKHIPTANEPSPRQAPSAPRSLKREIEDQGIFGGITNRLKKTADTYVNQKLDEIEARIDRKLDEIDRRLGEWRDKEVANRIRILKITLWASVIVAGVSLIYSYLRTYVFGG